jgi:hypothetical protein
MFTCPRDIVSDVQPWVVSGVLAGRPLSLGGRVKGRTSHWVLGMNAGYCATIQAVGWLLNYVEEWVERCTDGQRVTRRDIRSVVPGRRATDDEIMATTAALVGVGILVPAGDEWRISRAGIEQSHGYRDGVREGLAASTTQFSDSSTVLVATIPPSIELITRDLLLRDTSDLRVAVMDLVVSAQRRLVLASPFWYEETADELAEFLARRIAAGVRVELLGRELGGPTPSGLVLRGLVERLDPTSCRATSWYRALPEEPFGSETFHFKLAIADASRAYLGTANFTASGLRSRMELGVILRGNLARSLQRVVDVVLAR